MNRSLTKFSAGAAALVVAAGTGAATYAALQGGGTTAVAPPSLSGTAQTVKDGALSIGEVYERANTSVVEITVTTQASAEGPMGSGTAQAQGSGFVYDTSGHVITNAHVVDGAQSAKVRLADGKTYDANTVSSIVGRILDSGAVQHAYLGVSVTEATGGTAGAQLAEVRSGTPAAKAGLQAGDVLTSVDGDAVSSAAALQSAIDGKKPGDRVIVDYVRDGQSRSVTVTLGTRPS